MILRYILLSLVSATLTIIGWSRSWFIALFVDSNGDLPYLLRWFQPSDTKCWGDANFWKNEMPSGKWYQPILWYARSVVWLARNSAQGFQLNYAGADPWVLNELAMIKVEGNLDITGGVEVAIDGVTRVQGVIGWYKVSIGQYWHYRSIKPWYFGLYTTSEFGWRLHGIATGRPQDICRQLVFTPFRFIKFVR
jgi:hypothetical protein